MVEYLLARVHRPIPKAQNNVLAVSSVEVISDDEDGPAFAGTSVETPTAPAPVDISETPPISADDRWNFARPLGSTNTPDEPAVNDLQCVVLEKARALRAAVLERMPSVEIRSAANSDKGYVVNAEAGGHVCVTMKAHPSAVAEGYLNVNFVDNWCADIVLRINGMGSGFLPLMAMLHEPDLVSDYLPKAAGLPYIEKLEFEHIFAPNDAVYRCFVSPFGPLPGADDLHALTFFDLLDEPEGALMIYAESPKEGADNHRGWPIPKVSSWRRKRNYVLGASTVITPSASKPLELEAPGPAPVKCASPGCKFYAHSMLSVGNGLYCCHKCKEKPGKHGSSCEKCDVGRAAGPPRWNLPSHGTVDIELCISLKLPIPTWMIPLAFIRWVLIKLVKLVYPYLLALNERFSATPFAQRVLDDEQGFYAALRRTLSSPGRPWSRSRQPADPSFVFAPAFCPPCDQPQRVDGGRAGGARGPLDAGGRPSCVLQDTVESVRSPS